MPFPLLVPENAPVTRAVVVASGLLSVVFSAQRRARALGISYQVGRISPVLLSLLRLRLGFPNLCIRCDTTLSFILGDALFWLYGGPMGSNLRGCR
jgi:hypothetical protein